MNISNTSYLFADDFHCATNEDYLYVSRFLDSVNLFKTKSRSPRSILHSKFKAYLSLAHNFLDNIMPGLFCGPVPKY